MGKGKGGGSKLQVVDYFMSEHLGIAHTVDSISAIYIKEKLVWEGTRDTLDTIEINEPELFGGEKKEGGVSGTVWYLPGYSDQVLPDALAQRLGRAGGSDCPGFRGLSSIFFIGDSQPGFYWGSNNPYLPTIWVTVSRAPVGIETAGQVVIDFQNEEYSINGEFVGLADVVTAIAPGPTTGLEAAIVENEGLKVEWNGGTTSFDNWFLEVVASARGVFLNSSVGYNARLNFNFARSPDNLGTRQMSVDLRGVDANEWVLRARQLGTSLPLLDIGPLEDLESAASALPDGEHEMTVNWLPGEFSAAATAQSASLAPASQIPTINMMIELSTGGSATAFQSRVYLRRIEFNRGPSDGGSGLIGEDANPVWIIYESLTNNEWGMGSPAAGLDSQSFIDAALTMQDEQFGMSLIWLRQSSIEDFVQEILDHIQAVLFSDPITGLLTIKLIRGDYDEGTLPVLTPDNCDLLSFQRKLWGEIVNEIVVSWTNPANEQEETITVQDDASIAIQGGIISDSRNYYGVRNAELAKRLAIRDLRSAGQPLAQAEVEADRSMWALRPGSVVKLTWPEYSLSEIVMRVNSIDYGKPGDPTIKLSLMEDVYGLDVGDYDETAPDTKWEDPSQPPEPLDHTEIFTVPLFFAIYGRAGSVISEAEYPQVIAGVLASTDASDTFGYELWGELALANGELEWTRLASNNILGNGTLAATLPAEATSAGISFANLAGQTRPQVGGFVIIGNDGEAGNEIAMVDAVNGDEVDLIRGVLDTVPRRWTGSARVWFINQGSLYEDASGPRLAGETVTYRARSRTSQGLLPLDDASDFSETLTERPWLPNRPANVTAYGESWSSQSAPIDVQARPDPWVTVTWAVRNRLEEDAQVLSWTDASATPETGQTTTIEVRDALGTLLTTHDGLTGTTFNVPDASFSGEALAEIRVFSERTDADGSFVSLQYFSHWVQLGEIAQGFLTESGDSLLTEGGDNLQPEN